MIGDGAWVLPGEMIREGCQKDGLWLCTSGAIVSFVAACYAMYSVSQVWTLRLLKFCCPQVDAE